MEDLELVVVVVEEMTLGCCEFSSPSKTMSETLRGDRDLVPLRIKLDDPPENLSLPRFCSCCCSLSCPFLRVSSIAAANGSKSFL